MYQAFLIKYGEIGIKGKNRYLFEDALVGRIRHALKKIDGDYKVRKVQGRIFVDTLSDYDYDELIKTLQKVFGISGICPVLVVEDLGFVVVSLGLFSSLFRMLVSSFLVIVFTLLLVLLVLLFIRCFRVPLAVVE